jgi:hypothetical protein
MLISATVRTVLLTVRMVFQNGQAAQRHILFPT